MFLTYEVKTEVGFCSGEQNRSILFLPFPCTVASDYEAGTPKRKRISLPRGCNGFDGSLESRDSHPRTSDRVIKLEPFKKETTKIILHWLPN